MRAEGPKEQSNKVPHLLAICEKYGTLQKNPGACIIIKSKVIEYKILHLKYNTTE